MDEYNPAPPFSDFSQWWREYGLRPPPSHHLVLCMLKGIRVVNKCFLTARLDDSAANNYWGRGL